MTSTHLFPRSLGETVKVSLFKVVSYFTYFFIPWVVLLIICDWEIFRVVLVRSYLIIHPKKSFIVPIDLVVYYLFMHSIVSINDVLYPIYIVSYMYTIMIAVPSSFNPYNRQVSVFNCVDTTLGLLALVYYFNQKRDACIRLYMDLSSVNISPYVYCS